MLKRPGPKAAKASRPPAIAMFLLKLICCAIFIASGTAQYLWKNSAVATVKMAMAIAVQRVLKPSSSAMPRPSSTTIAIAAATSGKGRPAEVM